MVLINCGATDDIRSLCELPDNVRIVIIDHHRPVWHGHNVEDDTNTLVLVDEDDPVPKASVPVYNPNEQGAAAVACTYTHARAQGRQGVH